MRQWLIANRRASLRVINILLMLSFVATMIISAFVREDIDLKKRRIIPTEITNYLGTTYVLKIRSLHIPDWADDASGNNSPIELFENGVSLKSHALHADIPNTPGLFSHWGQSILFSPRPGVNPSQATYSLRMPWRVPRGGIYLWLAIAVVSILISYIEPKHEEQSPAWDRWLMLIAIGVLIAASFSSTWGKFLIAPDSNGYVTPYSYQSSRSPGYPWLISLVRAACPVSVTHLYGIGIPMNTVVSPVTPEQTFLLRVAQTQKLLWLLSLLILAAVLMRKIHPMAVFLFICVLLRDNVFFLNFGDNILTECLSQTSQFIFLAFVLLWLETKKNRWLVAATYGASFGFLIRPVNAFMFLPLIPLYLFAWRQNWRRNLPRTVLPAAGAVALFAFPSALIYWNTNELVSTPNYALAKITHALILATPDDVQAMPDTTTQDFLIAALAAREPLKRDNVVKSNESYPYLPKMWFANEYIYLLYSPLLSKMEAEGRLPAPYNDFFKNRLAQTVGEIVLSRHRGAYWRSVLYCMGIATGFNKNLSTNRIPRYKMLWYWWGAIIFLFFTASTFFRWCMVFSLTAHWLHLFLICLNTAPIYRMVFSTEFFLYFVLFFGIFGLLETVSGRIKRMAVFQKMVLPAEERF